MIRFLERLSLSVEGVPASLCLGAENRGWGDTEIW